MKGAVGGGVDAAHHRLDPDLTRKMRQEQNQREHARQGEQEGHADRHLWDETGPPVLAGAYGAQHGQGVGERREEEGQGRLNVPVRAESPQQPWGELTARQL